MIVRVLVAEIFIAYLVRIMLIVGNGVAIQVVPAILGYAHQHSFLVDNIVIVRVLLSQDVTVMYANLAMTIRIALDFLIHHYAIQEYALNAKAMETAPVQHLNVLLTIASYAHQTVSVLALMQQNTAATSQEVLA